MAAEAGKTGLELLMTYTTFHIGVYITLATAVIGADAFKNIGHWSLRFVALPCFAIAGLAGGVIASSAAEFSLSSQTQKFTQVPLGFWDMAIARYRVWATVEHTVFWVGVLVPALVFMYGGARPFQKAPITPHNSTRASGGSMSEKLKLLGNAATIVAALAACVAAIAAIVTLYQFRENLDFEKDKIAIEMFTNYSKQRADYQNKKAATKADTEAFAVSTQHASETIYRFTEGEPGWEETIKGMIEDNKTVLLSVKEWRCKTMHVKYYCIMQKALKGKLDCISAPECPETLEEVTERARR